MVKTTGPDDTLQGAYEIVLREMGNYLTEVERLEDCMPLLREIMEEIRRLDEIDLDAIEPATTFEVPW